MEIKPYLERINYAKPIKPDAQTLYGLHPAHMLAVPFENLDVGLKRTIHITEQAIYEKIVVNQRGGFCYELNGLFAWLLKQIGFDVTYLNARVFNNEGALGIGFGHLALLVRIPKQTEIYLADVGFGDSFIEPLDLNNRDEQIRGPRAYRLEQILKEYILWQKDYQGTWTRQYLFDPIPHHFPDEYKAGCYYHQTSPNSTFTKRNIISRASKEGRITLEEDRLITTVNGQRSERSLNSLDEYNALLKEYFGIVL